MSEVLEVGLGFEGWGFTRGNKRRFQPPRLKGSNLVLTGEPSTLNPQPSTTKPTPNTPNMTPNSGSNLLGSKVQIEGVRVYGGFRVQVVEALGSGLNHAQGCLLAREAYSHPHLEQCTENMINIEEKKKEKKWMFTTTKLAFGCSKGSLRVGKARSHPHLRGTIRLQSQIVS